MAFEYRDEELPYEDILERLVGDTSFWGETNRDAQTLKRLEHINDIMWWAFWKLTDKLGLANNHQASAKSQFRFAKEQLEELHESLAASLERLGDA